MPSFFDRFKSNRDRVLAAAAKGDTKTVKTLIEDDKTLVDAQDAQSRTPLFLASIGGHLSTFELLTRMGADPNVVSVSGQRAVDVLLQEPQHTEDRLDIAKRLLRMAGLSKEDYGRLAGSAKNAKLRAHMDEEAGLDTVVVSNPMAAVKEWGVKKTKGGRRLRKTRRRQTRRRR